MGRGLLPNSCVSLLILSHSLFTIRTLVKLFPSWLPGCGFQAWASHAREVYRIFTETPFQRVKDDINAGTAFPSFVYDNLVKSEELAPKTEDIIASTAASLYSGEYVLLQHTKVTLTITYLAAAETVRLKCSSFRTGIHRFQTVSLLLSFFLLMLHHPTVQERAYQEVRRVTGSDRLPRVTDLHSMPYIEAIVKEIHRCYPPIPLMPRSPQMEDTYGNMRIPKDSWVFTNIWFVSTVKYLRS